jgi:hypothetical protein
LEKLREYYVRLTDGELARQYAIGPVGFSSPDAWRVVEAEYRSRGDPPVKQAESVQPAAHRESLADVLARTWPRVAAAAVDLLFVGVLAAFIPSRDIGRSASLGIAMILFYFVCELVWQRTPGKALLQLKVVTMEGACP